MADKLKDKTIAFLAATEGVEQVELTEPWKAVQQEGGTPELIATGSGEIQAFNHLDKGDTFTVDHTVTEVSADDTTPSCCREGWPIRTSCASMGTRSPSCARSSGRPSPSESSVMARGRSSRVTSCVAER